MMFSSSGSSSKLQNATKSEIKHLLHLLDVTKYQETQILW